MLEEVKHVIEKVKGIPGLMTSEESQVLCRMARSSFSIVELGCYKGRSLALMGLSNPEATLYGVDWFGDMSHRGYQGSTLELTRQNLKSVGLTAEFFVGKTDEVAPKFSHTVDLLHIDAGHSFEECTSDLKLWVPKVNPGGAVCIHDYGKPHKEVLSRPEVKEAVDAWRSPSWTEIERAGTMIAFRNIVAEEGALYIAYGEKAITNVKNSVAYLRKQTTKLPVAVISDTKIPEADIWIHHREVDKGARAQKTRMYSLSPFRKTLYLDADTEMVASPSPGFAMLDHVDLVLSQDPVRIFNQTTWKGLLPDEVSTTKKETRGGELVYYNTGVIFFKRSDANRELFQSWNQEWTRWKRQDQPAFLRAIFKNRSRILSLREPWNTHHKNLAKFVFHAHRRASREGAPK